MGRLGEVLEAIYEAPRLDSALHIRAYQSQDQSIFPRLMEWWMHQRGQSGSGAVLMSTSGPPGEPGVVETDHELWWAGPDRWRTEDAEVMNLRTPDALFTYHPGAGGMRNPDGARSMPPWGAVTAPRSMLTAFDLELGDDGAIAGRTSWTLELRASSAPREAGMPFLMMPFCGQEHTCHVDQETGVLLAIAGRFEGVVCSMWTTTQFELLDSIDDAVFTPVTPDGSPFLDPLDYQIAVMERAGVDLGDIDQTDEEQVKRAIFGRHALGPIGPEQLAEQFVPKGPPPDDLEAAEAEIRDAFGAIVTPSEDGEAVPAVQGGENLGPCLREAGERAPGRSDVAPTATVDHLKFLGPDEAVVWFSLARGDQMLLPGMTGRAHRIDGRWLVAREAFAQIVGSVGVRCPPPPGP